MRNLYVGTFQNISHAYKIAGRSENIVNISEIGLALPHHRLLGFVCNGFKWLHTMSWTSRVNLGCNGFQWLDRIQWISMVI